MNIYNFDKELQFVNQIGYTLNPDEKIKLECNLQKINKDNQFDEIKFWGKIEGQKKDYYIALGLKFKDKYEFASKQFWWANNNDYNFQLLPEIQLEYKEVVDNYRSYLVGDPNLILIQRNNEENVDNNENANENDKGQNVQRLELDSDDDDKIKVVLQNFTELDRLSFIVRAIENDCQIVPVGSLKMTCSHEVRYNDTFQGIENINLNAFMHFRAPSQQEKKQIMKQNEVVFQFDFLDSLKDDQPQGCWGIQQNFKIVTVRNLLWPGYLAYHLLNSNLFGGIYFGNGLKNTDLPFILNKY